MGIGIDINLIKKEVADKLGISIQQLEEEISRIQQEAPGLISEKVALLILLERRGMHDVELINRIASEHAITRIADVYPGMRGITLIGRITRNLLPYGQKTIGFILDDGTERCLVLIIGERNRLIYRQLGLERGDLVLLRNVSSASKYVKFKKIYVDDESEISYLEDTDLLMYPVNIIPLPSILSVADIIKIQDDLIENREEIDLRGVVVWISKMREIKKQERTIRYLTLKLSDENDNTKTLRIVLWDKLAEYCENHLYIGDLVEFYGGVIKRNKYLRGKEPRVTLEAHFGNLASLKVLGSQRDRISSLNESMRANLFAFVLTKPTIKSYLDSNGLESKVAFFSIGDETGQIRVVVWRPDVIEVCEKIDIGNKVRVIGVVKTSRYRANQLEIHIHSYLDKIELNPHFFPKNLEKQKDSIISQFTGSKKITPKQIKYIIEDFSEIPLNSYVDIKGLLLDVRKTKKETGPLGIAHLQDYNKNEIIAMIWNRDILQELLNVPYGNLIIIRNAKSPKEIRGEQKVVFVGDKSYIEALSSQTESLIPLSDVHEDEIRRVFGTIIEVEEVGQKRFCSKCGLPVISQTDEGYICEQEHITEGVVIPTVVLIIDDDIKSARVFIKGRIIRNLLRELNISEEEAYSFDQEIFEKIKKKLVGSEIIIEGKIIEKSIDTDFIILAERIDKPEIEELIKALERE